MNTRFPLDLLDRLACRDESGKTVTISVADAERLRAFLLNMNKLDILLKDVELEKLEGPKADELRNLLRRQR